VELKECLDVSKEHLFGVQMVSHELFKHDKEKVNIKCRS
jgi:hypothetical protein